MKLLTSVLPRGRRLLPSGGWFTLALFGFIAGLEVIGRRTTSDIHDGLAGFLLVGVIALVSARHRRAPLGWVQFLGSWCRRLGSSIAGFRYDHGIDLRGTPPIPRRTPPVVWLVVSVLVVWSGLAAAAWAVFPNGWRAIGVYSLYTLYLVFLLFLWVVLLAVTFVGVFVPVAVLDKRLKQWLGDTDRRGAELGGRSGICGPGFGLRLGLSPGRRPRPLSGRRGGSVGGLSAPRYRWGGAVCGDPDRNGPSTPCRCGAFWRWSRCWAHCLSSRCC